LPYPSSAPPRTRFLAAVLAEGNTTIKNAATEPEITDLIKLLQKMGAIIEFGSNRGNIYRGSKVSHGAEHAPSSGQDRSRFLAVMALATDGDILVEGADQDHLITFLNTVRRLGGEYRVEEGGLRFSAEESLRRYKWKPTPIRGSQTTGNRLIAVLLTQAKGTSIIHETVYEDRFGYTEDLRRMGADIDVVTKCLGTLPCRFQGRCHFHSAIIKRPYFP
jgi:UDP-N-acetylglucosamine 1-carboxyvinyltransferase